MTNTIDPNDRTFKGFGHDIRTGDVVTIRGYRITVTDITHSKNHRDNNLKPISIVKGRPTNPHLTGLVHSGVIYTNDLIDITR